MKFSIITINKDNAIGLQKTMQSVFMQTWQDFEYLVIDGASNDGSVAYIQEHTDKLSYWISEPDRGVYQAMNKGIVQAHGEYLLFLNSGDFLVAENVLQQIFDGIDYSAEILCARCNVSKNGNVVWTSNPPKQITFGTLYNEGLAHQSTFIKRELFAKYGMYREDFKYNSDIEFWYRTIILNNATTEKLNIVVTDYNLDGISSLESTSVAYQKEMDEIMLPFAKYLPDYQKMNAELKDMSRYYWVKQHKMIDKLLIWLYALALKLNRK